MKFIFYLIANRLQSSGDLMNAAGILEENAKLLKVIPRELFSEINIQFSALFTLVLCISPIFTGLKRAVPLIIQKPIKATSHMHTVHNSANVRNEKDISFPNVFSCVRLISLH